MAQPTVAWLTERTDSAPAEQQETTMKPRRFRAAMFGVALAVVAASCGTPTDASQENDTMANGEMDDGMSDDTDHDMDDMEDMDMSAMNMGDPAATRADAVDGAALASGDLILLETRPAGYDDTAGSAWIARHGAGTTVTVELSGLLPDTAYISHLHADVCANSGGDHYQFEVGGSEMPPNEIHLAFTSDADGNGFMTAESDRIAGLEAVAFVVHPVELIENKIGCVDFVEENEGAAAAAIEAGLSDEG